MKINELIVTHNYLRHEDDVVEMIHYVKNGGLWTKECLVEYSKIKGFDRVSPLIQLTQFEDGKIFVHDGHHRVVATWLAGRDFLYSEEFNLTQWKYADYLEINHQNGWYTPFDPRIHTRTPDFAQFKKKARELFNSDLDNAEKWILENQHMFREERKYLFVPEMAQTLFPEVAFMMLDYTTGK